MKDQALQIKKCEIIEVSFDLVSYDAVMETIQRWRTDGKSHYVTLTNPHCVTLCHRDTKMRKSIEMADMTLPDGTEIILAAPRLTTVPLEMLSTSEKSEIISPTISSRKRPSLKT